MADHNGDLKNLFPPSNKGKEVGTGEILYEGDTYTFITPTANNGRTLTINRPVTFTLNQEGVVTNVTQNG
jgi:hypothetical protein